MAGFGSAGCLGSRSTVLPLFHPWDGASLPFRFSRSRVNVTGLMAAMQSPAGVPLPLTRRIRRHPDAQATHPQERDPRDRRRSAQRREGLSHAAPGRHRYRHRVPARRPGSRRRHSRQRRARHRDDAVHRAFARWRQRHDDRTPDVRLRGPGHRQCLCRPVGAGSADHGRLGRSVRVPAAVGGHRGAGRTQAFHPHQACDRSRDGDKIARFEPYEGSSWASPSSSTTR